MIISVLLLTVVLLPACASTPDTGVRKNFEQAQIRSVAIVPFYSRASFGMDRQKISEVRETYEAVATATLREQGFEVIDPRAFRQHLVELGLWEQFTDGIYLRRSLTTYFEPGSSQTPSVEVLTLAALAADDAFPVEALLFGELIYHTQGSCQGSPDRFTPYAQLTVTSGAPDSYPRPCVSSHFQAKLVDAQSGHTMWFNRMFHETHSRHIDDEIARRNITQAVRATIAERAGLESLAPQRSVADKN